MRTENVAINEPTPDGFVEVSAREPGPRMCVVELHGRRGTVTGTASMWRWAMILHAIKARYPRACMSPKGREPITVRRWRGGPIVCTCVALPGPKFRQ